VVDAYHLPKNLNLNGNWEGFSQNKTENAGNIGETVMSLQDQDATCAAQIAYADRILLNKCDLVSDSNARQDLLSTLSMLNPLAAVELTVQAEVSPSWILDIHAYEMEEEEQTNSEAMTDDQSSSSNSSGGGGGGGGGGVDSIVTENKSSKKSKRSQAWQLSSPIISASNNSTTDHAHDLTVSSINIVIEKSVVDLTKLKLWLADLLWENEEEGAAGAQSEVKQQVPFGFLKMEIFRMKGYFGVMETDAKHVETKSSYSSAIVANNDNASTAVNANVNVAVNEYKFILQVVHGLFDITETKEKWDFEGGGGDQSYSVKMVFIGKHLNRRKLELGLKSCVKSLA
jgi:G3E family GTPase